MALTLRFTEFSPTIWMNHVFLFGASGSVWEYRRFSDFLMHLGSLLQLAAVFHCVNYFHVIETASTAWSAFSSQMNEENKSSQAAAQHTLGAHVDVPTNEARVRLDRSRVGLRSLIRCLWSAAGQR